MEKVTEIACCQQCGKAVRKSHLHRVQDLFLSRSLCKECYIKHQRARWGYW